MFETNIGSFLVHDSWLRGNDVQGKARWRKLHVVFNDIVVVRAEYLYGEQTIVYTAVGDIFPEIPESIRVPEYEALVRLDEMSNIGEWKLVKYDLDLQLDDSWRRLRRQY